MKTAYKYDENFMWVPGEELYIFPDSFGEYVLPDGYTFAEIPQPNWKPKFDGVKWIETITDEELEDVITPPEEQPGNQSEIDYLKEKNTELEGALLELTEISSSQEKKVVELENSLLELSQYTAEQETRNAELENALLEMSAVAARNEAKVTENEEALLETTMLVGGMTNV